MTKIVIINPPLDSNSEGTYERWAPSMPLGYLGTALLDKGYDVEVIDAKYDSVSLQEIGEIVKKKRPRIIGITVMTEDFRSASITAKKVKSNNFNKVGLLATGTTVKYKIYSKDFDKFGIELVVPEEQEKVTKVIMNILAGKKLEKDKEELKQIIEKLKNNGAEAIVLGCTDIPILLQQEDIDIKVFDTVEVLAESTIKFAVKH